MFQPFKAQHEFRPSVPLNDTQTAHMFQMIPRINRKYLTEQFEVTGLCNVDTLGLLRGVR